MGRYLDIGGTRYLLEQLHDIMEKMLVGDIDLSDYVTQSELQTILDGLQIDVDLSTYATKEELENAIKGIDLSAYATTQYVNTAIANAQLNGSDVDLSEYALKTDLDSKAEKEHTHTMSDITDYVAPTIPSLDGYATEEYVDNALANIPTGGEGDNILVTLYNEWNKKRYATSVPTVKLYAGTNTVTLSDGVTLNAYINSTDSDYYIIDDYKYKSKVNSFTIDSETDKNLHDYIFRNITLGNGIVPQRDYSVDGTWYEGQIYNTSPPPTEKAYSLYFVPLPRGTYSITYNADKTPYLHPKTSFFVVDTNTPNVSGYAKWFDTTTTTPYTPTILCDYESADTIANTATFTIKSANTGIIVAFLEHRNLNTEGDAFKLPISDFRNIIDIVPTNNNVFEIEFTLTNGTHSDVYAIDITNFNNATQILRYSTAQLLERVTEEEFAMYTLTEFATKEDLENIVLGEVDLSNYYTKKETEGLVNEVDLYEKAKEQGGVIKNYYPAIPDSMYEIIKSSGTSPNVRFSLNTTEWNIEKYVGETINDLGTSHDFSVDRIVLASTVSKEDLLNKVDATVLLADNDGIWMCEITDGNLGRTRKFSSKNNSSLGVTQCDKLNDVYGNNLCPDFTNTFFHYDCGLTTVHPLPNDFDLLDYVTPVYFKYIPLGYFRNNYGTLTYSSDNTFKYISSTYTLNSEEIVKSILDDYFVVKGVEEYTEYYTRDEWALLLDNATKNEANVDLSDYYTKSEVDALIPTVSDGKDGTDGITPHIDETTKHWFIGETDTGVLAEGVNGTNGQDGADGYIPVRGTDYWTEQDIQTIKDYIDTELGVIENGSY